MSCATSRWRSLPSRYLYERNRIVYVQVPILLLDMHTMLFWIVVVTLTGALGLFAFWPLSKDRSSKPHLSPDDNPRAWYRDG